ncbi:MAG: hypothetical protein HY914_15245 [Desulfomonile tiedjei]|nr:hypothetical protein [Desulfomonile tiedjei]
MDTQNLGDRAQVKLDLTCDAQILPPFFLLLQQGVRFEARVGATVEEFLCTQLGIERRYLKERINTIFLDGKPVDDAETAVIRDGSTLALSAALPGLVGAAFRKGGFYARLREGISHADEESKGAAGRGLVTVKLYNLVAKELGPQLLGTGVLVETDDLEQFFAGRPDGFWSRCRHAAVDDRVSSVSDLRQGVWWQRPALVRLTVSTVPAGEGPSAKPESP